MRTKIWVGVVVMSLLFLGESAWAKSGKKILEQIRMDESKQSADQKMVRTLYDEGFTMVGEDDSLKIGAWMQTDARIMPQGHPGTTQFLVRRARVDLRGNLEKYFSVQVMGEFEGDGGTNAANLKQGFLEYHQYPAVRIRIGQFKEPYGLENLYSDLNLDFAERPIGENFIRPEQDLGLMIFGKVFEKRFEYGIGIFNGSGTNVAESNDDKDVAIRIAATPWAPSDNRWLKKLTFGGSFTIGKQTATLDGTGPTTPVGTRFFTIANPTGAADVTTSSLRIRAGADVEWLVDNFSFKSEYAFSHLEALRFAAVNRPWNIHGWSFQGTYLLTGETKTNHGAIVPKNNFNPAEGNWGGWEIVARFENYFSDQSLINAGVATGADDLWSFTTGFNWYLNRHIKLTGNYVFALFDSLVGAANGSYEHAGILRAQFNI